MQTTSFVSFPSPRKGEDAPLRRNVRDLIQRASFRARFKILSVLYSFRAFCGVPCKGEKPLDRSSAPTVRFTNSTAFAHFVLRRF